MMPKYLPPSITFAHGHFLDNLGALLDVARHTGETDQDYRQRMIDEQQHQLAEAARRRDEQLAEAIKNAAPWRMRAADFVLSAKEMEHLQAPLRICSVIAETDHAGRASYHFESLVPPPAIPVIEPKSWKELSADEVCRDIRKDVEKLQREREMGVDADWLWHQQRMPASVTPLFIEGLRNALRQLNVARSMFYMLQHANYYADPAVRQYCADMVTAIDEAKNKMIYGSKKDGE